MSLNVNLMSTLFIWWFVADKINFFLTVQETSLPKSVKSTEKTIASRQDLYAGKILFGNSINLKDFKEKFDFQEQLSAIPEFAHLGPLFKSSTPVDLTEPETEYSIKCIKHTFTNYIVFQVNKM